MYLIFLDPKKHLASKEFATVSGVKKTVISCLDTHNTDVLYTSIQALDRQALYEMVYLKSRALHPI